MRATNFFGSALLLVSFGQTARSDFMTHCTLAAASALAVTTTTAIHLEAESAVDLGYDEVPKKSYKDNNCLIKKWEYSMTDMLYGKETHERSFINGRLYPKKEPEGGINPERPWEPIVDNDHKWCYCLWIDPKTKKEIQRVNKT